MKRGGNFEALCLIHKMRKRMGKFQFFLSNMIVIDPKKPKNEQEEAKYDIIELLLNENDESECWIYACSISDDYLSNNKKSLTAIVDSLNKTFPSLKIRTRFIMPHSLARNDWTPNEIDIGRNVN